MDATLADIVKVTIASFFGAVVAPLVAYVIEWLKTRPSPNRKHKNGLSLPRPPDPERTRRPRWRTIVLCAVIGGVIFGGGMYFLTKPTFISSCPLFASTNVTITFPASGDRVSNQITVQGTACNIPQGKELWLLVTVADIDGYFPQGNATNPHPIVVRSDGTWTRAAYIGSSADTGKQFTLIPALVNQNDAEAKDAIQAYFTQPGPVYQGIEPLPDRIQLMLSLSVIRT